MQKPAKEKRNSPFRFFRSGLALLAAGFLLVLVVWQEESMAAKKSAQKTAAAPAASAAAGEQKPGEPDPLAILLAKPFTYKRDNRSDPFVPFVKMTRRVAPGAAGQEEEAAEPLTGMQIFEPGQLALVSIVFGQNKALAMVQDSVGKGYIIKEGTLIGRHGVVEAIEPNLVIIKESFRTSSGEKKYKNIEMVLRKEGEK